MENNTFMVVSTFSSSIQFDNDNQQIITISNMKLHKQIDISISTYFIYTMLFNG
jgi:hypothetical protein